MSTTRVQTLIDSVIAAHGVRLSPSQAAAMLAERDAYTSLLRDVTGLSCFEDEPGNLGHALAGRRRWRGAAR